MGRHGISLKGEEEGQFPPFSTRYVRHLDLSHTAIRSTEDGSNFRESRAVFPLGRQISLYLSPGLHTGAEVI